MTYLDSAIANGGITEPDERGLMPLDAARAWLDGLDRYVKGEQIAMVDGHSILESDRSWAALMSLADGAEFIVATRRLSWEFEVRGRENLAALERYGEAVLTWIADRVDDEGTLHNRPWCLLPCLLACPAPDAFHLARRIVAVTGDGSGFSVAARWVLRHPEPGYRLASDHPALVEELFTLDPRGTRQALASAIGEIDADLLLGRLGLVIEPLPDEVLRVLSLAPVLDLGTSAAVSLAEMDETFEDVGTTLFDNANYFTAAMRLTGFVVPGGQDGIVLQELMTGLGQYGIALMFATYGFGARPGIRWAGDLVLLHEDRVSVLGPTDVWRLELPNGTAEVRPTPHPEFGEQFGPMETVMLAVTDDRAGRDRTFLRPDQLVEHLALPAAAAALYTLDEWDQPAAVQPASSSVDLVLAVEALRERRAITGSVTGRSRDSHLRERLELLGGWGRGWS